MDGGAPSANIIGFPSEHGVRLDAGDQDGGRTLERRMAEARALEDAIEALARNSPSSSAKFGLSPGQRSGGYGVLGALFVYWTITPDPLIAAFVYSCAVVFCILILMRAFAAVSWIHRAVLQRTSQSAAPHRTDVQLPPYSLLVPLYREANIIADLVDALCALDYPNDKLEILLLIESDDDETLRAAQSVRAPIAPTILPIPRAGPRTKPKALNYGLAFARGDYIAVYDAEDRPDPGQLRAAVQAFDAGDANLAVVQAPLFVHNGDQAWVARQFELEYTVHFGAWLPALSQLGWPLPLGGTSNHFRARALRDIGGWDPFNVTEDADLGMRLASSGLRAAMITSPTLEEAPVQLSQWIDQRSRWIKGHLQTWLVLMRRPLQTARSMGLLRFFGMQTAFAAGLLSTFLHGPLAVFTALGVLTPLVTFDAWHGALLGAGYISAAVCAAIAGPLNGRLLAILTMPLYWPLQSYAALRALREMQSDPYLWRKTPHGLTPTEPKTTSP